MSDNIEEHILLTILDEVRNNDNPDYEKLFSQIDKLRYRSDVIKQLDDIKEAFPELPGDKLVELAKLQLAIEGKDEPDDT